MKYFRIHATLLVPVLLFLASCKKSSDDTTPPPPPPPPVLSDNDHILLGNPTDAQASASSPENYLKNNTYYKIGYSRTRGIPVWVGWHLQSEDMGSAPRQDDFRPDAGLPTGWYQVSTASYSSSGFDRGHNCPSADRNNTIPANSSTFLMTNIFPQAPNFNQGPWDGLEEFIRTSLVGGNNEAYIMTGNFGQGGTGTGGTVSSIDNGHVIVPKKIWKVVLVMQKGNNDLARINRFTTVLAVNMPNDNSLYSTSGAGRNAWRNYLTTINSLEADAATHGLTLNLFKSVPDSVRPVLKAKLYM